MIHNPPEIITDDDDFKKSYCNFCLE